jgi:hypothetical protein
LTFDFVEVLKKRRIDIVWSLSIKTKVLYLGIKTDRNNVILMSIFLIFAGLYLGENILERFVVAF